MTPDSRKLAIVGAGNMGKLHARVIAQNDRASLARVIDPREDAGRAIAEQHGAQWTPEIGSLADVDAVVLAAATEVHHQLALDILGQGKPLLIEKPVANNLADTQEILACSAEKDIPLMCGLLERYNPAVMTASALIDGPVHTMAVRHGPYAPRIKTGVAWDLLVHDVDLAIRLFGGQAPQRTASAAGHFHPKSVEGAEDTLDAVLSFPTGVASVSASRLGQRKVRSLVVSELERLVEIDLVRRDVTIYRHVSHEGLSTGAPAYRQQTVIEIPELVTVREPLATQLEQFLDLLDGKVDAADERDSILPSHQVVAQVLEQARH
ncbi:MAG: gfo/Idh/MocA family oxidoreductase [Actinophytocola sp.]|nr:gfo/Idh/MocA family oxidoreductase [Actinophytocola sp.]